MSDSRNDSLRDLISKRDALICQIGLAMGIPGGNPEDLPKLIQTKLAAKDRRIRSLEAEIKRLRDPMGDY